VFSDDDNDVAVVTAAATRYTSQNAVLASVTLSAETFYTCQLIIFSYCLQCFDAVSWAAGRACGLQKLSGGVLVWLSVWGKVQICIRPS